MVLFQYGNDRGLSTSKETPVFVAPTRRKFVLSGTSAALASVTPSVLRANQPTRLTYFAVDVSRSATFESILGAERQPIDLWREGWSLAADVEFAVPCPIKAKCDLWAERITSSGTEYEIASQDDWRKFCVSVVERLQHYRPMGLTYPIHAIHAARQMVEVGHMVDLCLVYDSHIFFQDGIRYQAGQVWGKDGTINVIDLPYDLEVTGGDRGSYREMMVQLTADTWGILPDNQTVGTSGQLAQALTKFAQRSANLCLTA